MCQNLVLKMCNVIYGWPLTKQTLTWTFSCMRGSVYHWDDLADARQWSIDCSKLQMTSQTLEVATTRCQFHQRHTREKFVRKSFSAAFSSYVLALAPKFVRKMRTFNVDEIDGRSRKGTIEKRKKPAKNENLKSSFQPFFYWHIVLIL